MIVRVLLAFDPTHSKTIEGLSRLLSRPDVVIDVATSTEALWAHVRIEPCDLVVVDRSFVPGEVEDFVRVLRESPDGPGLVLISDRDDAEAHAELLAAGCEAVLWAGLGADSLANVVEAIIEKRALQAAGGEGAYKPEVPRLADFASRAPTMQAFLSMAQRVAKSDASVLIVGETGVGKERLARAIHYASPRSSAPFIAVNCAAIPETLLESELFGHERGAFTGAWRSRRGCFELAHQGTILLDEVGDMPLHLQARLLRVLQEREIRRLGSERATRVDIRVMAATNQNLDEMVAAGRFRRDLYYRLGVVTLRVPPLRERKADIPELAQRFIDQLRSTVATQVRRCGPDAIRALVAYDWPGNVRELMNVIERAMLLCRSEAIAATDLPESISRASAGGPTRVTASSAAFDEEEAGIHTLFDRPLAEARRVVVAEFEKAYLTALLRETGGRIGVTAARAGITPRALYDKMKRYELRKEDFRTSRGST